MKVVRNETITVKNDSSPRKKSGGGLVCVQHI